MSISMNQLVTIALLWGGCFLQDKWFDKSLKYQLAGQASKLDVPYRKSLQAFDSKNKNYFWIITCIGLTISVLSFETDIDRLTSWIMLIAGVALCVVYIAAKLKAYNYASSILGP